MIDNCTLILNDNSNVTNNSIINDAWNTLTAYYLPEGSYDWTVNCTDNSGNTGTDTIKNIIVDITKPSINLTAPNNSVTLN